MVIFPIQGIKLKVITKGTPKSEKVAEAEMYHLYNIQSNTQPAVPPPTNQPWDDENWNPMQQ